MNSFEVERNETSLANCEWRWDVLNDGASCTERSSSCRQSMTLIAKKPCKKIGCPTLTDDGGYCAQHAQNNSELRQRREYDRKRNKQEHRQLYKSARWLKLRKLKLQDNPFCEMATICDPPDPVTGLRSGRRAPSTDVHHRLSLVENPELAFDYHNLQAACHACHSAHTAKTEGFARYRETNLSH